MGLFDFFKKKKAEPESSEYLPPTPSSNAVENPAFPLMYRYREYIVRFVGMLMQGNFAPIAAYEKPDGEVIGYLYYSEDMSYTLSVEEVVARMEEEFEKRFAAGAIHSYTIYYHSDFKDDGNHRVTKTDGEPSAISIKYRSGTMDGYVAIPYFFEGDNVKFKIADFSPEENHQILSTELQQDKDYFQERIEMKPETYETPAGITVRKVNNGDVSNLWGGLLGFERHRSRNGGQLLLEYIAYVTSMTEKQSYGKVGVYQKQYGDIVLKAVELNGATKTFFPVIRTTRSVAVRNKQIDEWINVDGVEAIISGGGRDTFGIQYFAADYAENKERYLSEQALEMHLTGMLYVLDKSEKNLNSITGGPDFSEDFVAYMPSKQLAEFGCFDFIGILKDHREVHLLENKDVHGYILTIKLINHAEDEDFFTIDMFVNKDNMRFSGLENGMKLTGMFQLMGEISK